VFAQIRAISVAPSKTAALPASLAMKRRTAGVIWGGAIRSAGPGRKIPVNVSYRSGRSTVTTAAMSSSP
jgi:hypothetical protein